jgi:hypothetical protein
MNRRNLLRGSACLSAIALVGCAAGSSAATISTQVLADAQGLIAALQAEVPMIGAADPGLMTAAQKATAIADLNQAATVLSGIAATSTAVAGATTLQQVEGYVNFALNLVAGLASVSGPYALPIQAVLVLMQGIEAYVNATLGTTATAAALRAHVLAPAMTPAEARVILGVRQ